MRDGPPGFPQDSTCPVVLGKRTQEAWSAFAYGTITLYCRAFQLVRLVARFVTSRPHRGRVRFAPATPFAQRPRAITCARFRLFPFRSPLLGESHCFLFLRVLRWFTSPRSPHIPYEFRNGSPDMTREGLPHSEIPGSKPVCGSPGLIAAYHVLHRRPAPRHPPCALSSLTINWPLELSYFITRTQIVKERSLRNGAEQTVERGPWWS